MTSIAAGALDDASDVTHSTAYGTLNALVDEGILAEERAEYLKERFKELHTRVLTIYKRDNLLLKRARQLHTELGTERERVHACGETARKDDDEIQKLKRALLAAEKELSEVQESESIMQVEALEYDRRKQNLILEREDALAAEEARLRPKMERVQSEITEMGLTVKNLVEKYGSLKQVQNSLLQEEATCKSDLTNFTATLAQFRQLYCNVEHEPERALKQLQLVTRSLQSTQSELSATEERLTAEQEMIRKLEAQRSTRTADLSNATSTLQRIRADIESKRKTLATLNTSLEVEMETHQGFEDRLTELDVLLKVAKQSEKEEIDGIERMHREKKSCIREFSRIEQAREDLLHEQASLRDQIVLAKKLIEKTEKQRKDFERRIRDDKKSVTARTKELLMEQSKEKEFTEKANLLLEDITDITDLITEKTRQEEIKEREYVSIADRRQDMARDVTREAARVALAKQELQRKDTQLREVRLRHSEMERRFRVLIEEFQKIKRERGQRATHIQAITQKMTEVGEKTHILENELEVLAREAALKEKDCIKKKRKAHELQQICVNQRLEKNRFRKILEKTLDMEREVRTQVRQVNMGIAAVEDTMTALRDTYANTVESRNQTGIQLIDRNDELGLLVEKVKEQEVILQQGVAMTNARGEEVKALKIRLSDVLRDINVCQRSLSKVKEMEVELARINEDIDDERWRARILENDLTDPNNPYRWRHIKRISDSAAKRPLPAPVAATARAPSREGTTGASSRPTTASGPVDGQEVKSARNPSEEYVRLQVRTQDLESRVNLINQKLRERELILAEVRELSDRIGEQADTGKEFTLNLAKQVNRYQSGIRHKTRQMMSTISELSLFQASSIQFQEEVERLEAVVAEAEARLNAGEAPFVEAEEDYEKEKANNTRYAAILQRRHDEWSSEVVGPSTVCTTAEPRSNAYIPENNLGLPKPYGSFAPFKPSFTTQMAVKALRDRQVRRSGRSADGESRADTLPNHARKAQRQLRLSQRNLTVTQ